MLQIKNAIATVTKTTNRSPITEHIHTHSGYLKTFYTKKTGKLKLHSKTKKEEMPKWRNGYKKILTCLNLSISTSRAIIKRFEISGIVFSEGPRLSCHHTLVCRIIINFKKIHEVHCKRNAANILFKDYQTSLPELPVILNDAVSLNIVSAVKTKLTLEENVVTICQND